MFETKPIKCLLALSLVLLALCTQLAIINATLIQLSNDNGTAAGYHSGWQAGDIIAAVLTPNPDWSYPIQIDSVELLLYQFPDAVDSTTVRARVYSVVGGVPDTPLGNSAATTINTLYPSWASIDLASANIVLSSPDPFMVAIEYVTGSSGSIPSTLTDNQNNIATGNNYYSHDGGITWYEHYDFWEVPEDVGYNMIRATVNDTPPPDPSEWKIYLPGVVKNWSPESAPTPPPPGTGRDLDEIVRAIRIVVSEWALVPEWCPNYPDFCSTIFWAHYDAEAILDHGFGNTRHYITDHSWGCRYHYYWLHGDDVEPTGSPHWFEHYLKFEEDHGPIFHYTGTFTSTLYDSFTYSVTVLYEDPRVGPYATSVIKDYGNGETYQIELDLHYAIFGQIESYTATVYGGVYSGTTQTVDDHVDDSPTTFPTFCSW